MLEIEERLDGDVVIVQPIGKIDTLTAKAFETRLSGHVSKANGALLVDMAGVEYVSSFGLRSLLIIAKQMAPLKRKFVLFGTNSSVMEVLRVSGFLRIIEVVDTEQQALGKAGAADETGGAA
jgi:anti-sigma B factor antagonist/stage II sporulation protein AA (anti-sigma F factor antagonist)